MMVGRASDVAQDIIEVRSKLSVTPLANVAQLVEASSHKPKKVAGLVPSRGIYERQPIDSSLPSHPSL